MLKFAVILMRKPGMSAGDFRRYFQQVHGPLVERLPGLIKYVRNYVAEDPNREHPGWDGLAELWFEDRDAMEAAWASPEGKAATDDLPAFVNPAGTTWSAVEENPVR